MDPDTGPVRAFIERSANMRVATVSADGLPHLTPLRFLHERGRVYALTRAASPAARHIGSHPAVVLLFDMERSGPAATVLRVRARAVTRDDEELRRRCERRAAVKYFLRPGGLWNLAVHWRSLPAWLHGRRAAGTGNTALIEFALEDAEFVTVPGTPHPG